MLLELKFSVTGDAAMRQALIAMYGSYEEEVNAAPLTSLDEAERLISTLSHKVGGKLAPGSKVINVTRDCTGGAWLKESNVSTGLAETRVRFVISQKGTPCLILTFAEETKENLFEVEDVGDLSFNLNDLKVNIGEYLIEELFVTDLNVPIGLNLPLRHHSLVSSLCDSALVQLALIIKPRFKQSYITMDYIAQARDLCYKRQLLQKEDVDFLTNERAFITAGINYEYPVKI